MARGNLCESNTPVSCHCENALASEAISGSWFTIVWHFQKYSIRDCFGRASPFLAMTPPLSLRGAKRCGNLWVLGCNWSPSVIARARQGPKQSLVVGSQSCGTSKSTEKERLLRQDLRPSSQ